MSWLKEQINEEWYEFITPIITSEQFKKDWLKISKDYTSIACYPEKNKIFNAFKKTSLNNIRVILIGEECYCNNLATGLCFDTEGKNPSINLEAIYNGFTEEYPHNFYTDLMDGRLWRWAENGILMFNTVLTVQKNNPQSHANLWKYFTTELFKLFNTIDRPIAYIAWGSHAQALVKTITNPKHLIVTSDYPSKKEWSSNGNFKTIENFIKNNYDNKFEWEQHYLRR